MIDNCMDPPEYYRTIAHFQIVEHNGVLHGLFERFKGQEEYDGICYFRYNLDDLKIGPNLLPTDDLRRFLRQVIDAPTSLKVPNSNYGNGRLRYLHLDIDQDINITYIPINKRKVDNECIFFGIIDNEGQYVRCPSAPVKVQGGVGKIYTFYRRGNGVVHPIRIFNIEKSESDDMLDCTVDNEGHWGQWR